MNALSVHLSMLPLLFGVQIHLNKVISERFQSHFSEYALIIITPANYVCGRVYCFHVVRPSVRPNE